MDRVKRYISLVILVVTLSACSSIASRVNDVPCSPVYTGTVCNFYLITAGVEIEMEATASSMLSRGSGVLIFVIFLVDLPFSFIVDTVALPADLITIALSDEPIMGIRPPR